MYLAEKILEAELLAEATEQAADGMLDDELIAEFSLRTIRNLVAISDNVSVA